MSATATAVMVDQTIRRHRSDLQAWANRVRLARNAMEAGEVFQIMPGLSGPYAAAAKPLLSGDRSRAQSEAERYLEAIIKRDIDGMSVEQIDRLASMIAGHAPRLAIFTRNRIGALRRRTMGA